MAQHEINSDNPPYAPHELPAKPTIDAADFFAVDMRTGVVTEVVDFPEARKPAYQVTVDFGPVIGTLRTSAQITNYSREELVGRTVVGALNLGSKRIAGFKSEFLILGSLDPNGTVRLLELPDDVQAGAPIA